MPYRPEPHNPTYLFNEGRKEMTLRLHDPCHRAWRYLPNVIDTLKPHERFLKTVYVTTNTVYAEPDAINTALKRAWQQLRSIWSSPHRSDYFINGLLRGVVGYLLNEQASEEQPMSTEKTFNPHVVSVVLSAGAAPQFATFDPDYFIVKKGDIVMLDAAPALDTSFSNMRLATVQNDPTGAEIAFASTYRIVERVDIEQYNARKEKAKAKDRARAVLHEAAKRTTEADLYERVKSKLTPEEQQLIKDSLGYGTTTEGSAD